MIVYGNEVIVNLLGLIVHGLCFLGVNVFAIECIEIGPLEPFVLDGPRASENSGFYYCIVYLFLFIGK